MYFSVLNPSYAQSNYDIPRVTSRPAIDGTLAEGEWAVAISVAITVETEPGENIPAPVDTEALLMEDGETLYVAAFGSGKVGLFDTGELDADTFVPSASAHVSLTGGGPCGVVLDEGNARLYVATRFDNAVSVVDTTTESEVDHLPLHNPEPDHIVAGRPFLYDAYNTSSNGEASCAACHVFGDLDGLAWDLGDPDGSVTTNDLSEVEIDGIGGMEDFHPLKGPMTTKTGATASAFKVAPAPHRHSAEPRPSPN